MKRIAQALVIAGSLVAGCQPRAASRDVTDVQAIAIADAYVAKNYPMSPRHLLRPVAHDQGRTWLVTYEPPEDSAGGTPTIEVDKRSSRVVAAFHDQ
jgi:hypothetical protein